MTQSIVEDMFVRGGHVVSGKIHPPAFRCLSGHVGMDFSISIWNQILVSLFSCSFQMKFLFVKKSHPTATTFQSSKVLVSVPSRWQSMVPDIFPVFLEFRKDMCGLRPKNGNSVAHNNFPVLGNVSEFHYYVVPFGSWSLGPKSQDIFFTP